MVSSKEDHVLPTFLVLSNIGQTGLIRAMVWTSIYLDFKKAFDSVDHVKLIEKLQNCNVESKLMKWIAAFLQNRKMKVKVKLQFSDWVAVLSGVPQGSVLGPLLFLIFVNDLPLWIRNSMILLFADDTKISCKISGDSDGLLLQQDLDSLFEWSKYWHLDFNVDKCKAMRVGHCYQIGYKLNGGKLQEVEEEKDLGLLLPII